jgi:hypothetical protein
MLYTIEEETLNGLADAVRLKDAGQVEPPILSVEKQRIYYNDVYSYELNDEVKKIKIIGRGEYRFGTNYGILGLGIAPGKFGMYQDASVRNAEGYIVIKECDTTANDSNERYNFDFEITIEGNSFTFVTDLRNSLQEPPYISFEAIGLDENGNEFEYTPLEMIDKINGFSVIPNKAYKITGDCKYKFASGGWDWLIDGFGNKITTKDITSCDYMFNASQIKQIPFDLNFTGNNDFDYMFYDTNLLTDIPRFNNAKPTSLKCMFNGCSKIRYFPEDFGEDWDWSKIDSQTSSYSNDMSEMFAFCYSLRKLPMGLLKHGNPYANYSYTIFYKMANYCHSLDEIIDLPNPHKKAVYTNSAFSYMIGNCGRLKNFTFAPMDFVPSWKNQILDFTNYVGYNPNGYFTLHNSGITADKEVKDDATYQALKDDPDWFTRDINYSRYNHDSAVRTLASLPDTSTYGSNTIKFKGASGALTDGGAINTLTEEEIAVASAKGWTVSLS